MCKHRCQLHKQLVRQTQTQVGCYSNRNAPGGQFSVVTNQPVTRIPANLANSDAAKELLVFGE